MMVTSELTYIKLSEVSLLPYNPRKIKKADFDRLVDSIKINGFWKHRPLAIEVQDGKNFVLCGNQRVKAVRGDQDRYTRAVRGIIKKYKL